MDTATPSGSSQYLAGPLCVRRNHAQSNAAKRGSLLTSKSVSATVRDKVTTGDNTNTSQSFVLRIPLDIEGADQKPRQVGQDNCRPKNSYCRQPAVPPGFATVYLSNLVRQNKVSTLEAAFFRNSQPNCTTYSQGKQASRQMSRSVAQSLWFYDEPLDSTAGCTGPRPDK